MSSISPFELDLESVILRTLKFWKRPYAEKVCFEYRRYLYMIGNGGEVVPPKPIDDFWHTHILDTEKYREDADKMGFFASHTPSLPETTLEEDHDMESGWQETLKLYEEVFKEKPPIRIWK